MDSKEKYKGVAKRRPRGSMKNKWRTYNEPKVDICHYSCLVILHVPDEEKKFKKRRKEKRGKKIAPGIYYFI